MAFTRAISRMIKPAMAAILACWICLWVLKPTKLWKESWRRAEDRVAESFLGDYGLDVLVFCYPVMLVAILGYIYQHLAQSRRRVPRNQQSSGLSWIRLSNPALVRSPLGLVSWGELLGGLLFASLVVWTMARYVSDDFHKLASMKKSISLSRLKQLKIMRVGVRFGLLAEICMAVLLLPVLRGMSLFKITGLQFEATVRYHIWIANILILFSLLHGGIIMFLWAHNHVFWTEIKRWQRTGRVNLAGTIALLTGIAIWITSLPAIRRRRFQLFYTSHHLYVVFIVFYLFHCGDRHFYLVLPGVLLFALDRILRLLQSRPARCLVSARLLPCKAVELTLSKHANVKYNPTSIVFVNVPSISKYHWHPFSVITSPGISNDRMTLIIKCHGWWTTTLHDTIQTLAGSGDRSEGLRIAVEGPYGPMENVIERYDSLILVAGGSGITPMLSIIGEAASGRRRTRQIPKIHLIYSVKRSEDLAMLSPISSLLLRPRAHLRLKAFVTQEEGRRLEGTLSAKQVLQEVFEMTTVSYKPDQPIGAARRPDGPSRRAAVAGLASLVFLAVLDVSSHFFRPRYGKGTDPSWIVCVLVISSVLAAACIAMAATAVTRKVGAAEEDGALVSLELVKANGLLPAEGLAAGVAEEHEVYFGTRPNLADLLEDLSAQVATAKVGVFVCGPKAMEESVARFCSKRWNGDRPEKPHLSFHSLSFSL